MPQIRPATRADAEILADQRVRMYADAELSTEPRMHTMRTNFVDWVRLKLTQNTYVGWLVEDNGEAVGGAGLWIMEWPPHFLDANPHRAYLLNFYVAPHMRHRGLARQLLNLSIAEAKARGTKVITLHASKFGRPIYERSGFTDSPEMIFTVDVPTL